MESGINPTKKFDPSISTRTLQIFKLQVYQLLKREFLDEFAIEPKIEVHLEEFATINGMMLLMRQQIVGEDIKVYDFSYPDGWWEFFKHRWFPDWLLKKYPVRMKEVKFDVRVLYPKMALPKEKFTWQVLTKEMLN